MSLAELQKDIETKIERFQSEVKKIQEAYEEAFAELSKKGYRIDKEKLPVFMARFWHTYPTKNPNEWEVAVPVIIPFNIGWFDRTEGGYNIFIINRYTKWFGEEIPAFIAKEITLPSAMPIVIDGLDLKFPEGSQELVEKRFGEHLTLIEKDKARVRQGHEFDLIAEIIDSGSLPFSVHPIAKEDIQESDFTQIWNEVEEKYDPLEIFLGKYSFQGEAWKLFEKYGAVGVFWAMGFGKTVLGTYIFSRIKGRKALVVPTTTLKEQWTQFFKWNCPRLLNEVEIYTYIGMSRKTWDQFRKKEFAVIGFDEAHWLPADTFSKLATLKTKYRFALSATPFREDGRTSYIMALSGYPIGVDWRTIMQVLGKEYHTVNVHIVKDLESKFDLLKQLYNPARRTLLFVNLIEIGERVAELLDLPFIHGTTRDRLEIAKNAQSFVASRVMELGVSLKDLEHIIEVDFLYGSRREQLQRTGRLMHSVVEGKIHDIIMTKNELDQYGKRLYGLYEKGFRYKLIPHLTGVALTPSQPTPRRKPTPTKVDMSMVEKLYREGYFQIARKFKDIREEIEKRGGRLEKATLFNKLNSMVRAEKLFKIRTAEGYEFKART